MQHDVAEAATTTTTAVTKFVRAWLSTIKAFRNSGDPEAQSAWPRNVKTTKVCRNREDVPMPARRSSMTDGIHLAIIPISGAWTDLTPVQRWNLADAEGNYKFFQQDTRHFGKMSLSNGSSRTTEIAEKELIIVNILKGDGISMS